MNIIASFPLLSRAQLLIMEICGYLFMIIIINFVLCLIKEAFRRVPPLRPTNPIRLLTEIVLLAWEVVRSIVQNFDGS